MNARKTLQRPEEALERLVGAVQLRIRSWSAVVIIVVVGLAGCSSDEAGEGSASGNTAPGGGAGAPPLPRVDVSSDAAAVVSAASVPVSEEESACIGARLDEDPELLVALGEAPQQSDRYRELLDLVSECGRVAGISREFAEGIQDQAGGQLSSEQVGCLRDGAGAWSGEQAAALLQAGLNPGSVVPAAEGLIDELLESCGVDRGLLAPIP